MASRAPPSRRSTRTASLVNRVRRVASRVEYHRDLVVHASVRRLRAYGLRNTLRWYLDHGHRPDVVDVRGIA